MQKMEQKNYYVNIANNDVFISFAAMNDQTENGMFCLAVKVIDLQSQSLNKDWHSRRIRNWQINNFSWCYRKCIASFFFFSQTNETFYYYYWIWLLVRTSNVELYVGCRDTLAQSGAIKTYFSTMHNVKCEFLYKNPNGFVPNAIFILYLFRTKMEEKKNN